MHKENVENIDFGVAITERYLSYALSTIMSRSLPDVRDGLKPVHRRLLYAMRQLKLDPHSGYKKCARVVGDVIGKYHPHGDTAVYDTLVRLAQDFSLRYPLIAGQGNFGSIDGDNAAAMRYTESRMTEICMLLMQDLDHDTVEFRATYDNSDVEPVLMPTMFPNLLVNGSEGIAVGMATNVPPHNLHEICDALIYLINNPIGVTCADVLKYIKGPDLPTGGTIIDHQENIVAAYTTGKGSFRIRAKWHQEQLSHGLYILVITEIPYQIQKSKLIAQIATLVNDKKLPLIGNIRDESAQQVRIVIEPKGRDCEPKMIMESLFKLTLLESRIQLNMNVLDSSNMPRVMNILEVLQEFAEHRKNIVLRRTKYQVMQIQERLEVIHALMVAYLNIDEVIRIIRDEDKPKSQLMTKFDINENQAEAILNIKLRALRTLEERQIKAEYKELNKQLRELNRITDDPQYMWSVIQNEILSIQQRFGLHTALGARRTSFQVVDDSTKSMGIAGIAFIEEEPVTIICSKMGWIRSIKGHDIDAATIKFKEGDAQDFIVKAYTNSNMMICTASGKFFTILANNIQKTKGHGQSIRLMLNIENDEIIAIESYQVGNMLLLASLHGRGFLIKSDDVLAATKHGKQIMNVGTNDKCAFCIPVIGDAVALIGSNRKLLVIKVDDIPQMKRGQGVMLQKYKEAQLCDVKIFKSSAGLSWTIGAKVRHEQNIMNWQGKRGSVGKIPPAGFPKSNKF